MWGNMQTVLTILGLVIIMITCAGAIFLSYENWQEEYRRRGEE